MHDRIGDLRGALIENLELTGCEITYEEAQTALPAAGSDFRALDPLLQEYVG